MRTSGAFFDSVDHETLLQMLDRRIGDLRAIELVTRWLKAGVMENGQRSETVEGMPQGAGISLLLANVFLRYALDLCGVELAKNQGNWTGDLRSLRRRLCATKAHVRRKVLRAAMLHKR